MSAKETVQTIKTVLVKIMRTQLAVSTIPNILKDKFCQYLTNQLIAIAYATKNPVTMGATGQNY
jgi:hypothetical protein